MLTASLHVLILQWAELTGVLVLLLHSEEQLFVSI